MAKPNARAVALDLLQAVLRHKKPLDEALAAHPALARLDPRDRGFARLLAATSLRRLGEIDQAIAPLLGHALAGQGQRRRRCAAAGRLPAAVPRHPAPCRGERDGRAGRRAWARSPATRASPMRCCAGWTASGRRPIPGAISRPGWRRAGSPPMARRRRAPSPPPIWWRRRWISRSRPTPDGLGRAAGGGDPADRQPAPPRVERRHRGPARLRRGRLVGAGCRRGPAGEAAGHSPQPAPSISAPRPGGKTAELAGARHCRHRRRPLAPAPAAAEGQSAIASASPPRSSRPMPPAGGRTTLAEAVLLDAPCSATGTIRRHPDLPWLKNPADLPKLTAPPGSPAGQCRRHDPARRGDRLCHLLAPARGRDRRASPRLLARGAPVARVPIEPQEVGGLAELLTPEGDLRSLPCHLAEQRRHGRVLRLPSAADLAAGREFPRPPAGLLNPGPSCYQGVMSQRGSESRPRSSRPTSPGWARRCAPSTRPAPITSMSM